MRITESQLRRIIRQTINEMVGPSDDLGAPGSPDSAVLQALESALDLSVMPGDVKSITFQPRRSGGVVTKIDLEYKNSYSWLDDRDISGTGMTLDDISAKLAEMGAKSQTRRPPMKHSHYYD